MTPLLGYSLLLTGMLAVSIPIIIHLLHRQKTTPIPWGAMMFLKESPLQMKRRKNIDQLILLLLRMAVLLFLAWLLARPILTGGKNSLESSPPVDLAIVLDHSLSMGRHVGDHTLFDDARGVIDQLTSRQNPVLRRSDTVSVILAEHRPRKFTPIPLHMNDTGEIEQLRNALHGLKPGGTDCTIPEAIEAAREVVSHGPNLHKVVLVVSDEQRTNWNIGDYAAWQRALGEDVANGLDRHVEIHSYPLAPDESASNISIDRIDIVPATVGINRPVQFTAKVSNSGPKDVQSLNIHLSVNGLEQGAPQTLANLVAGQAVTVHFDHVFTTPGSAWVRIWTDVVDSLAADNQSVAAVHVWQMLPVLVIDGQLTAARDFKSSMFLTAAMQPVDLEQTATALIQPKVVSISDSAGINLDNYFAVVLNDVPQLPSELRSKLASYVSSGHGLWIILGQRSTGPFISSLGATAQDSDQILFTTDVKSPVPHNGRNAPASVQIKDPNNPLVKIVAAGQRDALAGAIAQSWWQLKPRDPESQVVLATTSGDPLIISRQLGSGQIVVWATSVDGNWNNWHIMPNFVPLVNETIYQLSATQTRQHSSGNLDAGQSIVWSGPAAPAVQSVDVTLPDETVDQGRKANFRDGHYEFTYPNAFMPGLYQLRFLPTEVPQPIFYGVGIDRRELDNKVLSPDDQNWLERSKFLSANNPRVEPDQLASIITGIEGPSGFFGRMMSRLLDWRTLGALLVASLFFETLMTYRMTNLQSKIDVAGAGLVKADGSGAISGKPS